MGRKHKKYVSKKQRRANERAVALIVVFFIVMFFIIYLIEFAKPYATQIRNWFIVFIVLAVLYFGTRWALRWYKRRKITGELEVYLQKALKAMDKTSRTYTDEEAANRELVSILKALGLEAEYQFKLKNGRTADVKVGNMLIEGKLSPATEEVDRLLGQLQEYCRTSYKITVVIYGRLDAHSLERIEKEIHDRYPNKAFLTYLKNPSRQRDYRAKPSVIIKKYHHFH